MCVRFFALQKSLKAEKSPCEKKFPFSFLQYRSLQLDYYPAKFFALCFHFFNHVNLTYYSYFTERETETEQN